MKRTVHIFRNAIDDRLADRQRCATGRIDVKVSAGLAPDEEHVSIRQVEHRAAKGSVIVGKPGGAIYLGKTVADVIVLIEIGWGIEPIRGANGAENVAVDHHRGR